ncbi:protein of unknown function (plasmid) [Cupriavidus taiwanensis]|uniref:Uncharacterized protein n=1 Tax=Cupriavidus taiwanensis TaxID=164546 RepID=A0A7Z7NPR4_9BURK|nr:protein of unknown function [Cupriavidus taiwanensis]SOZ11658.1 protein of unknown function [Cupriavidus taiwanensis]SOZ43012.1 protein of unknown function [Cupriavidus taiwanensis]SPC22259.1 protein of unknown function [Cupriavidus taiwanensis]SPD53761.1 protein of unknown function [Cupriavidus taiwanensis]
MIAGRGLKQNANSEGLAFFFARCRLRELFNGQAVQLGRACPSGPFGRDYTAFATGEKPAAA